MHPTDVLRSVRKSGCPPRRSSLHGNARSRWPQRSHARYSATAVPNHHPSLNFSLHFPLYPSSGAARPAQASSYLSVIQHVTPQRYRIAPVCRRCRKIRPGGTRPLRSLGSPRTGPGAAGYPNARRLSGLTADTRAQWRSARPTSTRRKMRVTPAPTCILLFGPFAPPLVGIYGSRNLPVNAALSVV